MDAPSLAVFNARLDGGPEQSDLALDLVAGNPVCGQGDWNLMTLEVSSTTSHSMIPTVLLAFFFRAELGIYW